MSGSQPVPDYSATHHRRSIRLKGYDYSQAGAYFVTLCAYHRACLFGDITNDEMRLNHYGQIVREEWMKSAEIRAEIELDEYIIMPNHFHAIVLIVDSRGRGDRPVARTNMPVARTMAIARTNGPGNGPDGTGDRPVAPTGPAAKSIGALMAGFKSAVTKRINGARQTPGAPVWQRNYWEHIIRDEHSYERIATYIVHNPANWRNDQLFTWR